MTNEIIDKYLEHQGLIPESNSFLIATAHKSIRDWIMVAWETQSEANWVLGGVAVSHAYELATENIESSLGKPWEQVSEELEGMDQ